MAIRDRFRRALRRSDSTDDSASQSDLATTTTATTTASSNSSDSSPITKSPSKLTRTFTFGPREGKEKKPKEDKKKKKPVHPSEKPLTAQNLRHQAMLSQFTMTFGTNNPGQIEPEDYDGVSPCCTRPASIDGGSISPGASDDE